MYQFTELIVFFSMFFYYIGLLSFFFLWITSLQYVASLLINQKIKTTNFLICIKSSLSLLFFIALCNVYQFIPACFLLFSALTITIFTDLSAYLISRFVSLSCTASPGCSGAGQCISKILNSCFSVAR